ncbi:MAG: tRNA lysidine(34) synthetase TilS [Phycisphaerales bacterium]
MTSVRQTGLAPPRALDAKDPFARAVRASWRKLTGGRRVRDADRRTVAACSGGADSSALALALAGVGHDAVVIAHIVHDMRPEADAMADRDAVAALAESLGLPFREARVTATNTPGNIEAVAREQRLVALGQIARDAAAPFVATGHHADDQLETVLMRLARGTGPAGLAGIHPSRSIDGATLIRPQLDQPRGACEDACRRAGWGWRNDATNSDERRFRAAIRARVTPELRSLAPGIEQRIGRTCRLLESAAEVIAQRARELAAATQRTDERVQWDRDRLSREPSVVVGELLRQELARRGVSADDATGGRLDAILDSIADPMDTSNTFGFDGVRVIVRGTAVEIDGHAEK